MSNSEEKNRWKLSDTEISELSDLYVNQGWRVNRIARHFEINFSSVIYWIKQLKIDRVTPVLTQKDIKAKMPRAFLASTRHNSYENYVQISKKKAKAECEHKNWIKRCSCCGKILESDSTHLQAEKGLVADASISTSPPKSLIQIVL